MIKHNIETVQEQRFGAIFPSNQPGSKFHARCSCGWRSLYHYAESFDNGGPHRFTEARAFCYAIATSHMAFWEVPELADARHAVEAERAPAGTAD